MSRTTETTDRMQAHAEVDVQQSYGNCPQRIHRRDLTLHRERRLHGPVSAERVGPQDARVEGVQRFWRFRARRLVLRSAAFAFRADREEPARPITGNDHVAGSR